MFNKKHTKPFYTLIVLSLLCFLNCDGRRAKHKALKAYSSTFKINNTFTKTTYYPKAFTQINNDTLLDNGFHINIKYYTNMNSSLLKTKKTDTLTHHQFYRDFDAQLNISYNKKIIFNNTVNKSFFIRERSISKTHLKNLRLQNMWIDDAETSDKVKIHFLYTDGTKKLLHLKHLKLTIDKTGSYSIKTLQTYNLTL